MTKTFKTVAGFLRHMDEKLFVEQQRDARDGRSPLSDEEGERQIVSHLLRQFGISGTVGQNEKANAAVQRLLQVPILSDQQRKTLRTCETWLRERVVMNKALAANVRVSIQS